MKMQYNIKIIVELNKKGRCKTFGLNYYKILTLVINAIECLLPKCFSYFFSHMFQTVWFFQISYNPHIF